MVFKEGSRPYDEAAEAGVYKKPRKPGEAPWRPIEEFPDTHPDTNPEEALTRAQERLEKPEEEDDETKKWVHPTNEGSGYLGSKKESSVAVPQVGSSKDVKSEFAPRRPETFFTRDYGRKSSSRGAKTPRYKTEPTHLREKSGAHSEQPSDLQ